MSDYSELKTHMEYTIESLKEIKEGTKLIPLLIEKNKDQDKKICELIEDRKKIEQRIYELEKGQIKISTTIKTVIIVTTALSSMITFFFNFILW